MSARRGGVGVLVFVVAVWFLWVNRANATAWAAFTIGTGVGAVSMLLTVFAWSWLRTMGARR